jgi:hypothetical protein
VNIGIDQFMGCFTIDPSQSEDGHVDSGDGAL